MFLQLIALLALYIVFTEGAPPTPCQQMLLDAPYSGNVSVTNSGYPCQSWASQTPWKHKRTDDLQFPVDGSVAEAHNYCRTFTNNPVPWCHTLDPDVLWQFCDEAICSPPDRNCGGIMTSPFGRIRSPDKNGDSFYDDWMDCLWTIVADPSNVIEFYLQALDIQFSYLCRYDYLKIYEKHAYIGKLCFHAYQTAQSTESNVLYVQFFSDYYENKRGFELVYEHIEAPKCGGIKRGDEGTISSYDIDKSIFDDGIINCTWTLVVGYFKFLNIQIQDIDLEEDELCENEYIQFFKVLGAYRPLTDKVCGNSTTINITTPVDLILNFFTRTANNGKGFTAKIVQKEDTDVCWRDQPSSRYSGLQNVTDKGRLCQAWASFNPHTHTLKDVDFPIDGSIVKAKNYCRDPMGLGRPWCYTLDPELEIDVCNKRLCSGNKDCIEGHVTMTYAGNVSTTNHGFTCQAWSSKKPHEHLLTDSDFPYDGMSAKKASNYCRVQLGDVNPWCFTTDPNMQWDYCNIRICRGFDQECGGKIDSQSGWFSAPDSDNDGIYDHYSVCMWFFEPGSESLSFFSFVYLDILQTEGCQSAALEFFADGTSTKIYCGNVLPDELILTALSIVAKFVSSWNSERHNHRGFNVTYWRPRYQGGSNEHYQELSYYRTCHSVFSQTDVESKTDAFVNSTSTSLPPTTATNTFLNEATRPQTYTTTQSLESTGSSVSSTEPTVEVTKMTTNTMYTQTTASSAVGGVATGASIKHAALILFTLASYGSRL